MIHDTITLCRQLIHASKSELNNIVLFIFVNRVSFLVGVILIIGPKKASGLIPLNQDGFHIKALDVCPSQSIPLGNPSCETQDLSSSPEL